MQKDRMRKRGEANAFFIFLLKGKLGYEVSKKATFSLQKHELYDLESLLRKKSIQKLGISTLQKIFSGSHNERSCILETKSLDTLCQLLGVENYEAFKHRFGIDYNYYLELFNERHGSYDEHQPFFNFTKTGQDFTFEFISKIIKRDAEQFQLKEKLKTIYDWLDKQTKQKNQKEIEINELILNKRLLHYANLKRLSLYSLVEVLGDNINAGKDLFFNTGLSELCTLDLIQAWGNRNTAEFSTRISFYEEAVSQLDDSLNDQLVQGFWLGKFSKKKLAENFGLSNEEVSLVVSANRKELDESYDKLIGNE